MIWFLRMKRWVQNPPSPRRIKFVFAIVAFCLIVALIDYYGGWPEWMQADKPRRVLPSLPR